MTTSEATNKPSKRQAKANRFMLAGTIGAAAWLVSYAMQYTLLAFEPILALRLINYAIFVVFVISLAAQFFYHKADEFTSELWYISASVAFMCTTAWMLFATQVEYWITYALFSQNPDQAGWGISFYFSYLIPPATFYLTFFYKRWKG